MAHLLLLRAGHLFAGAVAGAASRTATAPLETLRLAVMTGSLQVRQGGWQEGGREGGRAGKGYTCAPWEGIRGAGLCTSCSANCLQQ
jgi:hypothetical protein